MPIAPRLLAGSRLPAAAQASARRPGLAFSQALQEGLARKAPIPFTRGVATGGLSLRRPFGVEVEFALDHLGWKERPAVIRRIGEALFEAGLTESAVKGGRHQYASSQKWRYETDISVTGAEVVSPVLRDNAKSWAELDKVIQIIQAHGGHVSLSTGAHVHVGTGDFGRDLARYAALKNLVELFFPQLKELSADPARGVHRGDHATKNVLTKREVFRTFEEAISPYQKVDKLSKTGLQRDQRVALHLKYVSGGADSHPELRFPDQTLDLAANQAQVKLALAVVDLANHPDRAFRVISRALETDSPQERLNLLVDALFVRDQDKRQMAALYATTLRNRQAALLKPPNEQVEPPKASWFRRFWRWANR